MTAKKQSATQPAPDKIPLTDSQAKMLSALTGIDASQFTDRSIAEISSEFQWQIDPNFFLFVRICGQVVKQGPANDTLYPVPYATVYAEGTICSFLGFFPLCLPWGWFFPFECHTSPVAQTTTDACGNFCIWIPRFEIEWILRYRLERICYLQLFNRPTVGSILNYLQGNPASTQAAVTLQPGTALYQKAEQLLGTPLTQKLASLGANDSFGSVNPGQQALLARPAFPTPLPPALPKQFRKPSNVGAEKHRSAVQSTLANNLGLNAAQLEDLNLNHYCGPFLRCFDIFIPEWVPIFEVPDISFRVTQNVGSGGTQVIYSGGPFDVPWNVEGVSNVTLVATSPNTVYTTNCNAPNVPCGNVPSLEYVGLMPLVNPALPAAPYIDATTGYATRPNQPIPSGIPGGPQVPPSTAPYTGTLQLYGCTQVDNAAFYRLLFTFTPPGSTTASAQAPFTGLSWPIYQESGGVLTEQWPVSDVNGWYPLPPAGFFPENLVLEWDTINSAFNANGLYTIQLQVGDAGKNPLATSAQVGFMVDNSPITVNWSAVWSFNSDMSGSQPLPTTDCIVIDRGSTPQDVYIQLTFSVTASHLRQVEVGTGGCAGGATLYPSSTPSSAIEHWYEDEGDNTFGNVVTYLIPASQPAGVYNFDVYADSRAFNPAGSDAGPIDDWNYNSPAYIWTEPVFSVAVVNEDMP
jgi:hypothetical protein